MSEKAFIPDTDFDYLSERAEIALPTAATKSSEAQLPSAEQRGCNLAAGRAAHVRRSEAETDVLPAVVRPAVVIAPYHISLSELQYNAVKRRERRELMHGFGWCLFAAIFLLLVYLDTHTWLASFFAR